MIGIYAIKCLVSEKVYIGKSRNIKRRWREHKNRLDAGKHFNAYLQSAYDKYGSCNFEFFIVKEFNEIDEKSLADAEVAFMDEFKSLDGNFGFNLIRDSSSETIRSAETRARMTASQRGRKMSQEQKDLLSKLAMGRRHAPEVYAKIGAKHKGRKHSEESKRKRSEKFAGRILSDEWRQKISNSLKGRKRSQECIDKHRAAILGRPRSEETKRKISESNKATRKKQRGLA